MAEVIGSMIVEADEAGTLSPDEISILENVALADLNNPECRPGKLKRAFSLGELYADEMPLAMTGQFFKAATDVLQNDSYDIDTRIDAARAADKWIRLAKDDDEYKLEFTERKIPLIPHVPAYFKGLLMVGRKSLSKADVTIILDNWDHVLMPPIERDAAKSILGELLSFNIVTFIKFHDDLEICQTCEWMFGTLGTLDEWPDACKGSILASGLLPVLANMMITNAVNMPKRKDAEESITRALTVLNTVLDQFWYLVEPPSRLISQTAYSVFRCLLIPTSGDNYINLRHGHSIISHFLVESGETIINQEYDNGKTGPQYILEFAARMLKVDESMTFQAIGIVKTLLSKLRGANKKLELVLGNGLVILFETVLNELREPDVTSRTEEYLLLIYARFMITECKVVLDFLSRAPAGPTGRSALAFVIADGFCRNKCELRRSTDDRRVVKKAMRKVLEYSRRHRNSELHKINLKGTKEDASAIPLLSEIRRIFVD